MAVFTDTFLYAVIVPVMPFALDTRLHMRKDESKYRIHPDQNDSSNNATVQSWVSVLIAVYGGALAVVSRECEAVLQMTTN